MSLARVARYAEDRPIDLGWQQQAACRERGPDLFFPPTWGETRDETEYRENAAKRVCATCPVITPCREHALSWPERHGVWGGLGEEERAELIGSEDPATELEKAA